MCAVSGWEEWPCPWALLLCEEADGRFGFRLGCEEVMAREEELPSWVEGYWKSSTLEVQQPYAGVK